MEKDLGRPIDWLAANHYDTEHPHTHIVLRGRDVQGKDLYVEKDYMTYGLRARASQLLTWILGPQRQQEQQVQQQVRQVANGVTHSGQDPDSAQRLARQTVSNQTLSPTRTEASRPDALALLRQALQRSHESERPPQPARAAPHATPDLTAGLERLRQALQRQGEGQHQQGRQRSRGQGMGW